MPSYTQNTPKSGAFFVEPGVYALEIVKAAEKTSQNGNPMISLTMEIKLPGGAVGPTVWDNLVFTPKASWKIDQVLASLGRVIVPGEDCNVEADDLIGMEGVAVIGEEPGAQNPSQKFNCVERWIYGEEKSEFLRSQRARKAQNPAPVETAKKEDDDLSF